MNIAVLATTRGTDLQAIIDEIKAGELDVNLELVVSHRKCYALERAKTQGFKAVLLPNKDKTREEYDAELVELLKEHNIDLVVLVGYMRILSPVLVRAFPRRVINVHPSLIPKFCGKSCFGDNVHEAVIAAGETETGMTIHFVDEGCDTGEIIMQKTVSVDPTDTPETLHVKVQALEKKWYPEVIRMFAKGEIK